MKHSFTRQGLGGRLSQIRRLVRRFVHDALRFLRYTFVAGALPATVTSAAEVYIFGDSGADMGNYHALPGLTPAAGSPFFRGADGLHRLSDGPMWPELQFPGMRSWADPARTGSHINFAYGGAKTDGEILDWTSDDLPFGLQSQLAMFEGELAAGRLTVSPDTSVILYAGTNDCYEGVALGEDPATTVARVAGNMAGAVVRLAGLGVRTIYVSEVADFGDAASFHHTGLPADEEEALRGYLNAFAEATRKGMQAALAEASSSLAGETRVVILPLNRLFTAIRKNPTAFGFTNLTDATFDEESWEYLVRDPSARAGYLFVDGLHTTARAQELEGRYYRAVFDAAEGRTQARAGRMVDGAIGGMDVLSRTLAEPMARQMLPDEATRDWQVFLSAPFSRSEIDSGAEAEKARIDTFATMLGLQWPESREPDLTLALSYLDQEGAVGGRSFRFDNRGLDLALYNERPLGPVLLRAEVAYGWLDVETRRDPAVPTMKARGSTDGSTARGRLFARHTWSPAGATLGIEGGLAYDRVDLDAFRESGAPGLELAYSTIEHESLRATLEARLEGREQKLGWLRVQPGLWVRSEWSLAGQGVDVTAELLENLAGPVTGSASQGGRWHTMIEPRLVFPLFGHAAAVLSYRYDTDWEDFSRRGLWFNISQRF